MINLLKLKQATNNAMAEYHRVERIDLSPDGGALRIYGRSWPDKASADAGNVGVENWSTLIQLDSLPNCNVLLAEVADALIASDAFAGAVRDTSGPEDSIELARQRKDAVINGWRLAANRSSFTYAGKPIACDALSRSDIDGANGLISLTGALPPGWPGAWKCMDNTYVTIPDVATWGAFYGAMVAAGTVNFTHAQTLKAAVAAATTVGEIDAITW